MWSQHTFLQREAVSTGASAYWMLLISNTELHAEGCRKDRDSNSLGPKCHLAHHMTAVSTETNLALSFSSTRPNLLPLSVPTGAAATVLNINNQCLKYSTFCTLSTICSFFPPKNWTDIQPCTSQRKLLSPCFTSVKSFKQTTVYELVLAASRLGLAKHPSKSAELIIPNPHMGGSLQPPKSDSSEATLSLANVRMPESHL